MKDWILRSSSKNLKKIIRKKKRTRGREKL